MSEHNLKRFEVIRNILQDDWEKIIRSKSFTDCLEDLLDDKKLHSEKTESIKKCTSHFFSESEQARILNFKTRIGKKIYYEAFRERHEKIEKEVNKLERIRDALVQQKVLLKDEIRKLASEIRSIENIDADRQCVS